MRVIYSPRENYLKDIAFHRMNEITEGLFTMSFLIREITLRAPSKTYLPVTYCQMCSINS